MGNGMIVTYAPSVSVEFLGFFIIIFIFLSLSVTAGNGIS